MAEHAPLAPGRFLGVMAQVCRALAAAHAAGFVHRDLKPDNIFLVDRGRDEDFVKLLDFGLTKAFGADRTLTETTGGGDAWTGSSWARRPTSRPSRRRGAASITAPTSTPSASCSTS